jgi:Outer membrane protein beta-barrel family/CarboxypepD_reg-like domain
MKHFFTIIFFLISLGTTFAQQKVAGRVLDEKKQPSPFANVLILNTKDSSFVKGNVADIEGNFSISQLISKQYLLQVTAVGYQKFYQKIEVSAQDLIIPDISLVIDNQTLATVEVTARKLLIERIGDKMIMNVDASPITSGLNGLELMEKVPGVTVDRNSETIKIKGKAGVMVMIDDRKTYLDNNQLAAFLKTLKSDDIDKIEVITNPSARYDASGTTAIINIKTKKGKNLGTNYIIDLAGGYSYYDEYGGFPKNSFGLTLNSKKEKYSIYTNISRSAEKSFSASEVTQQILENKTILESRQNKELTTSHESVWSAKVGLDYDFSKKTSVGFSLMSAISASPDVRKVTQQNRQKEQESLIVMDRNRIVDNSNYIFNTHWRQTFDTSGTVLNVDFDIIFNKGNIENNFLTTTTLNKKVSFVNNQILAPNQTLVYVFKSDFEKQFTKKTKLEAGIKTSFGGTDSDFDDNFRDNGALVNSFFRFSENINAGYLMLNTELTKKTSLQIGLRGEHTRTQGEDRQGKVMSKQDYFNLFPTIFLNKKVTKDYTVSLGYSRRIERPDGFNFNYFKRFFLPQQYVQGNPTLLPELNNTFNLTHTIKDAFSFSFDYTNIEQFSTSIYGIDTTLIPGQRLIRNTAANVAGKVSWWGFDTSLPFDIANWWNVNLNLWNGINVYQYNTENAAVDVNQWYGGAYIQQTFTLSKNLSAELSGYVESGETWGFQTSKPQGGFDIGFKQFVWNKKATLKLAFEDPLNISRNRSSLTTNDLTNTGVYRWDNRRVRIGFTYNFGNTNVKVNEHQSGEGGGGKKGGKG